MELAEEENVPSGVDRGFLRRSCNLRDAIKSKFDWLVSFGAVCLAATVLLSNGGETHATLRNRNPLFPPASTPTSYSLSWSYSRSSTRSVPFSTEQTNSRALLSYDFF